MYLAVSLDKLRRVLIKALSTYDLVRAGIIPRISKIIPMLNRPLRHLIKVMCLRATFRVDLKSCVKPTSRCQTKIEFDNSMIRNLLWSCKRLATL